MAGLLPLACLGLLVWLWRRRVGGVREAMLAAGCTWGVIIVVTTEGLSVFHALTFAWLLGTWSAIAAGLVTACVLLLLRPSADARALGAAQATQDAEQEWGAPATAVLRARLAGGTAAGIDASGLANPAPARAAVMPDGATAGASGPVGRPDDASARGGAESLTATEYRLLAGVLLIVVLVGLVALLAPPNNWDSMSYHMSRVMHWLQNASVAHFPTHYELELYQPPWAEWAILHLQVLSGSDRLANCVQWLAMVASVAGVSLLARELGAGARGQTLAAVIAATIPMGILQASGTQNNYVLAFWLVAFVYYLLTWQPGPAGHGAAAGAGTSLGLAALTKGTAYPLAAPVVLWLAGRYLWQGPSRQRLRGALLLTAVAILAAALNAGHWWRNWRWYGSPLTPPEHVHLYQVSGVDPKRAASNVLKNLSLQVAMPAWRVNYRIEAVVRRLHQWVGVDADDPRTTFPDESFHLIGDKFHEDSSSSPLHLLAITGALGLLWWQRPSSRQARARLLAYAVFLLASLLAFCLVLKWQPWGARLHLPLLVLGAPLAAVILARWPQGQRRGVVNAGMAVLLAAALPVALLNAARPLVGPHNVWQADRLDQYFANRRELNRPYQDAVAVLAERKCQRIGLVSTHDRWEYPLWVLAAARGLEQVDIRHGGLRPGDLADRQAVVLLDPEQRQAVHRWRPDLSEEHDFGPIIVFTPPAPQGIAARVAGAWGRW